jgi:hypothetical protein
MVNSFGIFGAAVRMDQDFFLLALLCAASGLQNAAVTTSTGAAARTTHLTGITTDLGIGLVRTVFRLHDPSQRAIEIAKNRTRIGTILAFGAGGAAGAALFLQINYAGFLLPAGIAAYMAYLHHRAVKSKTDKNADVAAAQARTFSDDNIAARVRVFDLSTSLSQAALPHFVKYLHEAPPQVELVVFSKGRAVAVDRYTDSLLDDTRLTLESRGIRVLFVGWTDADLHVGQEGAPLFYLRWRHAGTVKKAVASLTAAPSAVQAVR